MHQGAPNTPKRVCHDRDRLREIKDDRRITKILREKKKRSPQLGRM